MPSPVLCAQTVRLLPTETVMPFFAVRVSPSQRIRFTSPLTVTRLSMVVVPVTAYQPEVQVVGLLSSHTGTQYFAGMAVPAAFT